MSIPKSKGGMGFRDFNCFNKALLAKQFWRLWCSPDNLVSRIMKAKYYAQSSILEAKIGSKPSFAWRSILGSCNLVKEGLFWKIGNGEKTRIWGDKWVPRQTTFSIQSGPKSLNPDAKVIELIDRYMNAWNKGLLEILFSPEEVNAILKVPINSTREDALIWKETANGVFSVKSAYHAAMKREACLQASSSCRAEKKRILGTFVEVTNPQWGKKFLMEGML
jgi:hypothetical protein